MAASTVVICSCQSSAGSLDGRHSLERLTPDPLVTAAAAFYQVGKAIRKTHAKKRETRNSRKNAQNAQKGALEIW
jgi:hypothetical protein